MVRKSGIDPDVHETSVYCNKLTNLQPVTFRSFLNEIDADLNQQKGRTHIAPWKFASVGLHSPVKLRIFTHNTDPHNNKCKCTRSVI